MFNSQTITVALWYMIRFINMLILVRIALQFFNVNPSNFVVQFIYSTTEPILVPIRNFIYNIFGYSGFIDFSPLLAMFLMEIIYNIIIKIL